MRKTIILALLVFCSNLSFGQIKIHSHNDYVQKRPFFEAYEFKADEIEADIFLVGDSLIVAHSKKQIDPSNTLNKLYLAPIAKLFKQFKNRVSADRTYTFSLMIDVKENWNLVYPVLKKEIEKYGNVFNRSKSKYAIQIVISGDRPTTETFHTYPKWLFFDGLPDLNYAKVDFNRVTMISDNFASYSKWKGTGKIPETDRLKLLAAVKSANEQHRNFRFWGAPDNEDSWRELVLIGAKILNTDKVKDSKHFLTDFKR